MFTLTAQPAKYLYIINFIINHIIIYIKATSIVSSADQSSIPLKHISYRRVIMSYHCVVLGKRKKESAIFIVSIIQIFKNLLKKTVKQYIQICS